MTAGGVGDSAERWAAVACDEERLPRRALHHLSDDAMTSDVTDRDIDDVTTNRVPSWYEVAGE